MKLLVFTVGALKDAHYRAAEAEYLKRLRRYCDLSVREHKDEAALIKALPATRLGVLLDERGDNLSSAELAQLLAGEQTHGRGRPVVFVIGGAEGASPALKQLADRTLAFGRITLPHRLARVVLVEQLYRAHTILRGEPYHK